jgi:GST-like protein
VRRFTDEANRLYGVMNNRLYERPYLAGEEYSIADMISYPWCVGWQGQGQQLDDFKYVKRWYEELRARPAVERGMAAGADMGEDYSKLSKEEIARRRDLLYNQRARPVPE